MQYSTFTTSDNTPLAFQTSLPLPSHAPDTAAQNKYATCILLLHGFSGSSAYFTRNLGPLSAHHWTVAPDMRGHGRSGHNPARGGYHVARLAADLRELLAHLDSKLTSSGGTTTKFIPVGCSIGAAVVWTYLELFGEDARLAGYVFVDQAPLQDRALLGYGGVWDARVAHRGCFDEASLLAAQRAWVERPAETHRGLVAECLGYRFQPQDGDRRMGEEEVKRDEEFFVGISQACDGVWLARLLADHTRYDHREAVEGIVKPTLVMAGRRSGCFPLEGLAETVERVKKGGEGEAEMVVFESGHWLFYEEPERFNQEVLKFPKIHFLFVVHPDHAQHAGCVGVHPVPPGRAPRHHHQPVPAHDHVMSDRRLAAQHGTVKGSRCPAEKCSVAGQDNVEQQQVAVLER
ncbi:Alpha/Beta hydrolase protein [Chaetomidium leptoderma]|uniref:Alpha/Beta hydrolase protein n=1 Tax=Chaetomidium leptoderma TaxID=669021 RepID=A0AAN6VGC2_9PEZI|nr:Alpha/Beta hydrolase protein [Chaetomidium leptoderma]